jgi:hypothetical protein
MTNYIPDVNRFKLAGPPKWFLLKLWDFDPSLVVVPSRQDCLYRLAQRRKLNLPDHIVMDALFNESDTKMLARYSLVPVTSILATANWSNPYLFVELANRAPWRLGGAEKVNQMLEDQEWQEELDRRRATGEHLEYLGKDAWKLYNKKIGVRSNMYSPTSKKEKGPSGPTLKVGQRPSQSHIPQSAGVRSGSQSPQVGSIFLP